MWHDHATILKMGFVMITVHVMYDPAVFYTDEEYQQLHAGVDVNIQAEVEQPEIHLWRSLKEMQTLATGGRVGSQPGALRPFDLKVKELRSELEARGMVVDNTMHRADLQKSLDKILRGVMRVPALLLSNPTQQLTSLNLEKYEIVASEPLHDIKGHVINLITELPNILPPGDIKSKCTHLIDCCLAKERADLRRVVIQLYLLLKDLDCSCRVLLLLQSIIKIGRLHTPVTTRGVHVSSFSCTICAGFTWSCARTSLVSLKKLARGKCLGTMYML